MEGWLPWARRLRAPVTGGLLALLVLVAVATFGPFDPTLTNLRLPKDGVANWLGTPGALLGGSLVEWFGAAALLVPLLIANYTFNPAVRQGWRRYAACGAALLLLASSMIWLRGNMPTPTLWGPGVAGWCAARWLRQTVGLWPGLGLLLLGCSYGLGQVLGGPRLQVLPEEDDEAPAEARPRRIGTALLTGLRALRPAPLRVWLLRLLAPGVALVAGLAAGGALLWRGVAGVGSAAGQAGQAGLRSAAGGLHTLAAGMQAGRERAQSLARGAWAARARRHPPLPAPGAQPQAAAEPRAAAERLLAADGPDMTSVEQAAPSTGQDEPPPGAPAAAAREPAPPAARVAIQEVPPARGVLPPRTRPTVAAAGPAPEPPGLMELDADLDGPPASREARVKRWERLLTRYRDNLDLDWDAQGWRKPGPPKPPAPREPGPSPRAGKPGR